MPGFSWDSSGWVDQALLSHPKVRRVKVTVDSPWAVHIVLVRRNAIETMHENMKTCFLSQKRNHRLSTVWTVLLRNKSALCLPLQNRVKEVLSSITCLKPQSFWDWLCNRCSTCSQPASQATKGLFFLAFNQLACLHVQIPILHPITKLHLPHIGASLGNSIPSLHLPRIKTYRFCCRSLRNRSTAVLSMHSVKMNDECVIWLDHIPISNWGGLPSLSTLPSSSLY